MPVSKSKPESQPDPDRCQVCEQPLPATGAGAVCPACLVADALAPLDSLSIASSESFEAGSKAGTDPDSDSTAPDKLTGTTLGPGGRYKLLQRIGEGGFGTVYMADQTSPVRRRVAVKVLKAGMDTRQVIARFEAERQALAMMDHPNIARILDGGETDQGRPFFVMELVRGTPITEFCDEENLDTRQRLQLFMKVCGAVQHAHQKGVIHRDLKPGNILVTVEDGAEPVPKVIDFGVAKATEAQLTDKTLFTRFEQMIGTPAYMSPEQAGTRAAHDLDTRADIYALGVLLYELLTGTTPIESATLKGAAFDEVRRILREEDAPRPSARLSSLELDRRTTIAKSRATESATLGRQLRGDLDWIVMKAIEKDRRRRYDTANALAADVERHLEDEPVSAGPPTAAYRMGKFLRRKKATVAVASIVLLSLLAGLSVATVGFARAKAEAKNAREAETASAERLKEAEAISGFITGMFESAKPGSEDGGRTVTVAESLKIAEKKLQEDEEMPPARRAVLQTSIAGVYLSLGLNGDGAELLKRALESYRDAYGTEHPDTLNALHSIAHAYEAAGYHAKAMRYFEDSAVGAIEALGIEHHYAQRWMRCLSVASRSADGLEEINKILSTEGSDLAGSAQRVSGSAPQSARERVIQVLRHTYEEAKKTNGREHPDTILAMVNLSASLHNAGRLDDALQLREELVELRSKVLGPEHPDTLSAMHNLANSYSGAGRKEEALEIREEVLALRRKVLGPEHTDTLSAMHNLANSYDEASRNEEALKMREEVLSLRRKVLGAEHPATLWALNNVGNSYHANGRNQDALELRRLQLQLRRKVNGEDHPETNRAIELLGEAYKSAGQPDEALVVMEQAVELRRKMLGPEHPGTLWAMHNLANSYAASDRKDEALEMREEVLALRRKVLGPEHPEALSAMHNLAISYDEASRNEEALKMREEVLSLRRKVLGAEHPDTLSAMNNLGLSYSETGRKAEALEIREGVLALCRKVLGSDHAHTLSAMNNLGNSYHANGRNQDALELRRLQLQLRRKVNGEDHPETNRAIELLGEAYKSAGQPDEALVVMEQAVELRRKMLGPEHPGTLWAMHNLANSYAASDRKDEALEMREEVLALRRKVLGPEHPETLVAMLPLANSYSAAGRKVEALAMREETLQLMRKVLGSDHAHTLLAMNNLGISYHDNGRNQEALEIRLEQLQLSRKINGEYHSDTNNAWRLLTDAYGRVGRQDELIELLEREVERRETELGPEHPDTFRAMQNLAGSYDTAGRQEEALALESKLIGFGHVPVEADSPAVEAVLVPADSVWRWLHPVDGVDPAESDPGFHRRFSRTDYDDTPWHRGKDSEEPTGGFGYGDEGFTGVDIGTPSTKALGKSAYFRHRFTTEREFTNLELRCHRDDGIIVYLDGKEVARGNMSDGEEAYRLHAAWTVGGSDETAVFRLPLEGFTLAPGEHVLAISLHNTEEPSSDLRIGAITLVEVEEVEEPPVTNEE